LYFFGPIREFPFTHNSKFSHIKLIALLNLPKISGSIPRAYFNFDFLGVPEINAIKTLISYARTAKAVAAHSIGFVIPFGNCQKVNTAEMTTEKR